ncbi:MAG: hypothetical protein ACKVP3_10305 [Hyphomicrobiaceae bacterium]
MFAAISGGLFWLVWIYGNGLRDPRYLDGWVLAGGMGVQIYFHFAKKTARLSPKSAMRWRKIHIFLGYLLIAAFILHSDFSLPDTAFEWALWAGFVVVALSGIFGTYLAWSLQTKRLIDEGTGYDRIPALRAELARHVQAVVAETDPAAAAIALPAPPYDAWIADLYKDHLRDFFQGQRNSAAHLIGSQRPLKQLTDEIDNLSRYVDQQGQEKLAAIKNLVVEKDRLDFARVYLGLTRAWLFVHVPVTYALIVLTVLHVLVVYAYSAGLS